MIENQNIICFSSVDWISYPTSKIYLMRLLSKRNRVLYVETIGSKTPNLSKSHLFRIIKRICRWLRGPVKPSNISKDENITICSPIIIPVFNSRWILKINSLILRWSLKRIIRKLRFQNPVLWFYLPTAAELIGHLGEKFSLYHCVDQWSTYPGGRTSLFKELENKLFEKSNAVFISNRLVYEERRSLNKNTYYLPHGVEFEHYQRKFSPDEPLPDDIANLRHPVIGIVGEVASWIDLDLVAYIAKIKPGWSIVAIGPIGYDAKLGNIKDISNIYILGKKDYSELPNYYRAIDVFIIPFILNEHIKYSTPTRLYEHLSSGKPIVAIDFPAAREIEEGLISLSFDKDDFVKKIELALEERNLALPEKRKALAKRNSWNVRMEEISHVVQNMNIK